MARIATVQWTSPPPTSVDEELAVYDDGTAWLAVRVARDGQPTIGSWSTEPSDDDIAALDVDAARPLVIDLLRPLARADLTEVAERVAAAARGNPVATATFHAAVTAGGSVSLLVVAAGARPVRFEIDPESLSIHVERNEATTAWYEVPRLETGFVTADAEGLGGVGRIGEVAPGGYGAIALPVPDLDTGPDTAMALQLAGWLHDALPDHPMPERFTARTAAVPVAP